MELHNRTPFDVVWLAGRLRYPAHSLTLIVKATFDLIPGEAAKISEEQLVVCGDEPFPGEKAGSLYYESDLAYQKPCADRLLVGRCHSPKGAPTVASQVRFTVGNWSRTLHVIGNRNWKKSLLGSGMTSPEPFTSMDLRYENSFGGVDYAPNPVGKGFQRTASEKDDRVHNIEDPNQPVKAQTDRPVPAGFGPIARAWWPRKTLGGTYGKKWFRTRAPWFPEDIDWKVCNAAPLPSLVDGYLRGDEPIHLLNVHPTTPQFESRLPGLRARCLVERVQAAGVRRKIEEPSMVLDTLWIDSERSKLVLVWRGTVHDVASDEFEDLKALHVIAESMDRQAGPTEELAANFLESTGGRAARDASLSTESAEGELLDGSGAREDAPAPSRDTSLAAQSGSATATPESQSKDSSRASVGVAVVVEEPEEDLDIERSTLPETTPVEDLKKTLEYLPSGAAATPEIEETRAEILALIAELEQQPMAPPEPSPQVEWIPWTRDRVLSAISAGDPLAGEVLAELDLSGVDFRGVSLRESNLHGCDLREAKLAGCDLSGADLSSVNGARLDLSASKLAAALLREARLEETILEGAQAAGADLTGAILEGAKMGGANFDGATLRGARMVKIGAAAASFVGACLDDAKMDEADLRGAAMNGASLVDATLTAADLSEATLDGARGPGLDLTGADLAKAVVLACDFTRARCRWVRAEESHWVETKLDGADFFEADLDRAELSKCSMVSANLAAASFRQAILHKTNLEGATLLRADFFLASLCAARMTKADLRGANLFGADLSDASLEGADLQSANVKRTRLEE